MHNPHLTDLIARELHETIRKHPTPWASITDPTLRRHTTQEAQDLLDLIEQNTTPDPNTTTCNCPCCSCW